MRKLHFLILFLISQAGYAQYDTYSVNESPPLDSASSEKLYFGFSNLNYLRNHEYFNRIWDGYTLFGSQFNPRLVYFPNARLRVDGGLFLDKEFGREAVKVQPTFTVKWKSSGGKNTFVTGTIEGNINHKFLDPVYDYERLLTARNEYGVQWLHNSRWLESDLFINWERMIHRGDTTQEELTAGLSASIKLVQNKKFYLHIPLQGYLNHNGGQINVTAKNLSTLSNSAAGLRLGKKGEGFIKEWRAEAYYVLYKDLSPNPGQAFTDGDAMLLNLLFKSKKNVDLMLTYWSSNEFLSSKGNPLYANFSSTGKFYTEKQRQLLFVRILWDQQLFDHFYAHFRLEPYYDLNASLMEYSYSLFISYRQNFLLKDMKAKR